ncbi:N,N-dimethylformamidase [Kibdelosporangium banguiense]|uniref:N,N-dimethylformamidase n=1 Tax=Kibdelosporangium banguiense TaxID=1365924 RepID=A0ABS4U1Q5_9PSEU|nr:N,N-dimethylformamidase beta subunit family domain-containing protein [Kibdelosporangium banguiense]MBP2330583.1 N,N-dimethylformamidase [Kibdelosporangium banguiense]
MDIVGYPDRFSVAPGQTIKFMVSSRSPAFRASLVRLLHNDSRLPVPSSVDAEFRGVEQRLHTGSYVKVQPARVAQVCSFTVQLWMRPTTPDKDEQTVVALGADDGSSFELLLRKGCLSLIVREPNGLTRGIRLARPVALHTWYFVVASYDAASGMATIVLEPVSSNAPDLAEGVTGRLSAVDGTNLPANMITLAARLRDADGPAACALYNGKLESPRLFERHLDDEEIAYLQAGGDPTGVPGLLAAWDFAEGISSTRVVDRSVWGLHGVTVQRPTRAMTGHNWDGIESDWRHAPEQYGAIHFHDDDLDDAGWEPSVEWRVPDDMPSGVYTLHVESDDIPFVVRPHTGAPSARILLVLPTFSYLAYANQHMLTAGGLKGMLEAAAGPDGAAMARGYPTTPADKFIVDNRLNSLYDHHSDGSGVCYSSRALPVLTMRPGYVEPALDSGSGALHQLAADLCLVKWLHDFGYDVDVVTDEDLYREGTELLSPYKVVLTGTHHEYWSRSMLDAVRDYLNGGGRLMNLSGNGFYWVTELDPEHGRTIEIRRRPPSTRIWESAPGEGNLSFTGEQGGLWRYRDRPPQRLVGVGFTAQGLGPGRPYTRCPDSYTPQVKWVFEGIGEDELIGDHPGLICSHGAAGFEIDRADHALGTPWRTALLASATGFPDSYQHCSEEIMVSDSAQGGSVNDAVRADMVLLDYPNDGAVFSTGSIAWCGCLSYNNNDNTVSQVTRNVLERFLT